MTLDMCVCMCLFVCYDFGYVCVCMCLYVYACMWEHTIDTIFPRLVVPTCLG